MTTVAAYRSAQRAGRDGFAQLMRAEWIKFRSVRGWLIGMVVAGLLTLVVGLLGVQASIACTSGRPGAPVRHGAACVAPTPTGPGGEPVTDSFYFVRQPLTGNGSITAQVTSLTGKQGAPSAPTGPTTSVSYTQDIAGLPGLASAAHSRWLRLTRSGDVITGYDSADGTRWTQVGSADLAGLPSTAQAGLFATSPTHVYVSSSFGSGNYNGVPSLATGVFDHVSVSSGQHGGAWTGVAAGGPAGFAPGHGHKGYRQVGGQFTVTGSVIGLVTFVLGLIAAIIAVLVGTRLSHNQGIYVFPVSWLTETRVVAGTAALLAVAAVLALAVGTILRRSAAAITAVVAGIVLSYILAMASLVPLGVAEWLLRVTPAAGFAIQQSLPRWPQVADVYSLPDYYPLGPWAGFAVLCGYAALALGLAVFLLRRRDA